MSYKNALAQAMLFGFMLIVSPSIAMDNPGAQQAPTQYILSKGGVYLPPLDFPNRLNAKFLIEAPQGAQTEETLQAYVDAQRPIMLAKLTEALRLYLSHRDNDLYGESSEKIIAGIQPTDIFFSPDTNMLSLIQKCGTHTVAKGVTISLKTRIDCKFDLVTKKFTPGLRIIHINQKQPTQKKFTATMDMLYEHFPSEKLAGSHPDSVQKLLAKVALMRSEREAGLLAGKNPDTLPNHIDHLNSFFLEDLKKLASFYLLQHTIEDIE